jgi:hypothetical protein
VAELEEEDSLTEVSPLEEVALIEEEEVPLLDEDLANSLRYSNVKERV